MTTDQLRAAFTDAFRGAPAVVARAPGRVNLIGEHTDYNDGWVLPFAIDRAVRVALRPSGDERVRLRSLDFAETVEAALGDSAPAAGAARWSDYVRGVAWALREHGHPVGGFDALISGDVPRASGLSSSAALCVATAFALAAAFRLPIDAKRLALYARRSETGFVGVQVGVMDQLASALGRAGHALLIDCRTIEALPVPLDVATAGLGLWVIQSGVPRRLAASAYNERVAQCAAAVDAARRVFPDRAIAALRDLTPADLPALAPQVDDLILRRARHVVTENERVHATVAALERADWPAVGRLLLASHASLRDDYQVSLPELDLLVDLAMAVPGALGARLTGAGFGGGIVCLAPLAAAPAFDTALARYHADTNREPSLLHVAPMSGASLEYQT